MQLRQGGGDTSSAPTLLHGGSASSLEGLDGLKEVPSADCESIPVQIRAKAGRAAARPPVDPNKEQSRTKALEAMKRRASLGSSSMCGGPGSGKQEAAGASGNGGRGSSMSRSSSIVEYLRSPVSQSRELSAECMERQGVNPNVEFLSAIENETAQTDTSLSDSDIDDGMAVCACR